MRTYGRVTNQDGSKSWVRVDTDLSGNNDAVWLTTLAQCLLLNLGESPFYAGYGIPARQSIMAQIFPDYNTAMTQQQFAQYFANLSIVRTANIEPTYNVSVTTNSGDTITASIGVPV